VRIQNVIPEMVIWIVLSGKTPVLLLFFYFFPNSKKQLLFQLLFIAIYSLMSRTSQVHKEAMIGYDHLVKHVRDSFAGSGDNWANEWEEEKGREKEKKKKKNRRARA